MIFCSQWNNFKSLFKRRKYLNGTVMTCLFACLPWSCLSAAAALRSQGYTICVSHVFRQYKDLRGSSRLGRPNQLDRSTKRVSNIRVMLTCFPVSTPESECRKPQVLEFIQGKKGYQKNIWPRNIWFYFQAFHIFKCLNNLKSSETLLHKKTSQKPNTPKAPALNNSNSEGETPAKW